MAELLIGSASAAAAKAKTKYLWQNEGPAQPHAGALERKQPTIPASAVGGTLRVHLVGMSGLDGPHGLNPKEPPYLEIQIGEMTQCSRPASPPPGGGAVASPRLAARGPANGQLGWAAPSFLQPQTFVLQGLQPAFPPSLQVSVFSRRNGACERLVAVGHIILSQVWAGGWHTVNTTLVSRAKGTAPAHIRINISFTQGAAAPAGAAEKDVVALDLSTAPKAARSGDLESPNSTLNFGDCMGCVPALGESPPRSPRKLMTRLKVPWRTVSAVRN